MMPGPELSTSVISTVDRWRTAEAENDHVALAKLLTLDFVGVGPRGWRRTRDEWVDRYRTGTVVNESIELSELDIRLRGRTALVVAVYEQRGSNQGKDASGRFRLTLTVVEEEVFRVAGLHLGPLLP